MKNNANRFLMWLSPAPGSCLGSEYDFQFHRYHMQARWLTLKLSRECDEAIQALSDARKAEGVDLSLYNPKQGTSSIREVLRICRTV